jgi:hypothetical protein
MNLLDENIPESQRQLLRSWRIRIRQIGDEVGRKGMKDEAIIPLLHQQGGNYFETIAGEYLKLGKGRSGRVGAAPSYLFDAADLVTFAIQWMERTFGEG